MNPQRVQSCCLSLLCLLALGASAVRAQDKPNKVSKESVISNKKRRTYYAFVPANIKAPAPLIVLLHGSGHDGMSLVEPWKDLAGREGFIVAGPDAESGGGWSAPRDGPDFLHDVVEDLKSKYSVDPHRIYLFGHSAGAVFALMMAMDESEYFAAVAVHAGAFRTPDDFQNISNAKRKIPLAIWVGTADQFFPLSDVRATRDALRSNGFPIEVTEIPGHTHWYYDLAASINQHAWEFLKKYELRSEPLYSQYIAPGATGNANRLIGEINALGAKALELVAQSNEKEKELGTKDFEKERSELVRLAHEQIDIFTEAAGLWRTAAEKAESARSLGLSGKQKQYFGLVSQYNLKCAELLDAMRERAEALIAVGSPEVIEMKRAESEKRADKLHEEIDELRKAIDRLKP